MTRVEHGSRLVDLAWLRGCHVVKMVEGEEGRLLLLWEGN